MSVCALGASSQHLRVLTEAGLLVERCEGTRRLYRVFVGNNPLQLGQIGIPEVPLLEQGQLAAVALRPVGTLYDALARRTWRIRSARRSRERHELCLQTHRRPASNALCLAPPEGRNPGEIVWLRAPIEFRVAPEALHLLKPDPRSATDLSQ